MSIQKYEALAQEMLETLTLDQIASQVRDVLASLQQQLITALEMAFEVGDLLLVAQQRAPKHEFEAWLEVNVGLTYSTANRYMRIAYYKDKLPPPEDWETLGRPSAGLGLNAAQEYLAGLPSIPRAWGATGRVATEADKELAATLRKEGLSYQAIADKLGRDSSTVYYWLNPKAAKQNRDKGRKRRRLAREMEQRQERDAAARRAGGAIGRAYSQIRLCAEALDQAIRDANDTDTKGKLRAALNNAYKAEDRITEALKL